MRYYQDRSTTHKQMITEKKLKDILKWAGLMLSIVALSSWISIGFVERIAVNVNPAEDASVAALPGFLFLSSIFVSLFPLTICLVSLPRWQSLLGILIAGTTFCLIVFRPV